MPNQECIHQRCPSPRVQLLPNSEPCSGSQPVFTQVRYWLELGKLLASPFPRLPEEKFPLQQALAALQERSFLWKEAGD